MSTIDDEDRAIQYSNGFQDGFITAKEQAIDKYDKVIIAHERIAYERGVADGYAKAIEEDKNESRPQGEWIPSEETYTDLSGTIETYTRFKCDQCLQGQNFGPYPFCPWCGADMKPKEEEQRT